MTDEALVEALAETPHRLRALFAGLGDAAARRAPADGEWAAADVLIHLRASDAIIAPRIPQILVRPDVVLPAFDDGSYARLLERAGWPIATQLDGFEARRSELVALLRALTAEEWELTGQHEARGTLSVRAIAAAMADHEREHLDQIDATVRRLC